MSDDEGGEDYGDYEEIGEPGLDEDAPGPGAPEEGPADAEGEDIGLDEDAAGTDDDDESDEDGTDETEPLETGAPQKAQPQRPKTDPLLKASNRHRIIRLVPDAERVTDNRLQRPEAAYILAVRAAHISKYATNFTHAPHLHDPVAIAFKELFDRRCPLRLRRPVGTGPAGELLVEEWIVNEMTLPPLTPPVPLGSAAPPR